MQTTSNTPSLYQRFRHTTRREDDPRHSLWDMSDETVNALASCRLYPYQSVPYEPFYFTYRPHSEMMLTFSQIVENFETTLGLPYVGSLNAYISKLIPKFMTIAWLVDESSRLPDIGTGYPILDLFYDTIDECSGECIYEINNYMGSVIDEMYPPEEREEYKNTLWDILVEEYPEFEGQMTSLFSEEFAYIPGLDTIPLGYYDRDGCILLSEIDIHHTSQGFMILQI